uniref:Uncharacterized protein n=1 Tax=Cajanus cajan TaxID=3821 RepID=A0A151T3N2_CAJCA|nr:hypothetical protein KK1_016162 [Cajanus cajan]
MESGKWREHSNVEGGVAKEYNKERVCHRVGRLTELTSSLNRSTEMQFNLRIPFINLESEDQCVWRWSKNDCYTVRSTYHGYINEVLNVEHLKVEGE